MPTMKMTKTFYICLFFLLMGSSASAMSLSALLFEPSVGYRHETVQWTDMSHNETKLKAATPVYGLKFGYRSPIGVDVNLGYDHSNGKMDISAAGETQKSSFSHQTGSAQLGINALGLMKIYLGYAFLNELKLDGTDSVGGFKLSGPAYLVGLQFKIFPFLNLGAQYNLNQFNQISGDAYTTGDDTERYFSKIDSQDYSLYLSLAF